VPKRPRPNLKSAAPENLTAQEYVHLVVLWAEEVSVRKKVVDMPLLRKRVEAATANATAISETYEILQAYLDELGDNHSHLYTPTEARLLFSAKGTGFGFLLLDSYAFPYPNSPAELAGIRERDRVISINGVKLEALSSFRSIPDTSTFELSREGIAGTFFITVTRGEIVTAQSPKAKTIDNRLGYFELPGLTGTEADQVNYARTGINAIAAVDAVPRCGWVLDMRRNSGGFPYYMLLAIQPFIGNGDVASLVDADGRSRKITMTDLTVSLDGRLAANTGVSHRLATPNAPIAVLTSPATASAAELALIALYGRPNLRVFGQPTTGVPSGNLGITLPDNSFVAVTNTYDADRLGRVYTSSLIPDETIASDWSKFATDADPVIGAATTWLRNQPACSAPA
jgi:carboxyl-terminal processing protease